MAKAHRTNSALLPTPPLLITESKEEFDRIRGALHEEIKPRGIIEEMYVADIAHLVWEVLRLRRCKAGIINAAFRSALQAVLTQLLREPGGSEFDIRQRADKLARNWFSNPDIKKNVPERFENLNSINRPLKRKRSESRPKTSNASTGYWHHPKFVATRRCLAWSDIVAT